MSNNFENDIKYIPYKEVVKKKALEFFYANKEVISEKKTKVNINRCHLNKKRRDKKAQNGG